MKHLLLKAAIAAFALANSTSMALAVGYSLDCTAGSIASEVVTLPAYDFTTIVFSNGAGSSASFSATLSYPASGGGLEISGGTTILIFSSKLTETITTPVAAGTFLILETAGADVTLTMVCNPGSGAAQTVSDLGQNPATSAAIVRDSVPTFLKNFVRRASSGKEITVQQYQEKIQFAVDRLGMDESLLEEMLNDSRFSYNVFNNIAWLMSYQNEFPASGLITGADDVATYPEYVINHLNKLKDEEIKFSQRGPMTVDDLARRRRYSYFADAGSTSSAVAAIDESMGIDDIVQGSFNMLGYGPMGRFSGDAVLGEGENWWVIASANGAISQTSGATGDSRSISGRGTINIVTSLTPNLGAGLAFSLGATSDTSPGMDDRAYHYAANGVLSYRLSSVLTMTGQLGYELTSHNYDNGVGTGSGISHYYNVGVGLEGDVDMVEFKLTPRLDVELVHESAGSVTLSDATVLDGFDRTTGKAIVGGQVSRDYYWMTGDSEIIVTPSLGADASLSHSQKTTAAGVASLSTGLGVGLSAGVGFGFEGGLDISLSTRVTRAGDTTGASLTGGVGGNF